jgi:ABC-type dipeptide/oligopeptide/nickel transport system ATPase component
MQQRVVLAMALAGKPELLVADEPTTALDVTIQAQILDLLRDLRDTLNLTVLLITHNLGLVADMADEVHVMQNGRIVESGNAAALLRSPSHPYTMALRAAVPSLPGEAT